MSAIEKIPPEKEFEQLKKHFIMKTLYLLKKLEDAGLSDYSTAEARAELALFQFECSEPFMELCKFILKTYVPAQGQNKKKKPYVVSPIK